MKAAFRQTPRAVGLVFQADAKSAAAIVSLAIVSALLPAAMAWIGKLIVDQVLLASRTANAADAELALTYVGWELGLVVISVVVTRTQGVLRSVLGTRLGYHIRLSLMEKARSLELVHFETPAVYDKLQNARREAGARPLNLFMQGVEASTAVVTLITYGALLWAFSPWVLLVLLIAALPSFLVEARFSGEAFRLFSWRAPEGRKWRYLELLLTQDRFFKEVQLYGLADHLLERYRGYYRKFFKEERSLALRRGLWSAVLSLVATAAFYACYFWVVYETTLAHISLGEMTMYLVLLRQGQNAFRGILRAIGASYEDNLFISNLFKFLDLPTQAPTPKIEAVAKDEKGLVLEDVTFVYPGRRAPVVEGINLSIGPSEKLALVGENGAGKSTLIKLITGLYQPTRGEVRLDGLKIRDIPVEQRRERFAVVLQDFVQYQLSASDNVGFGQVDQIDDQIAIETAAEQGGATEVIADLPEAWQTQLGRWFDGGVDLSLGNWQKLATSRAFMRSADVLVLDEPTASLDAEAEHALFQRFAELAADKMALLVSHRFSTVRMADRIAVIRQGKIVELGTHDELVKADGRYAHLFSLQARGYL